MERGYSTVLQSPAICYLLRFTLIKIEERFSISKIITFFVVFELELCVDEHLPIFEAA